MNASGIYSDRVTNRPGLAEPHTTRRDRDTFATRRDSSQSDQRIWPLTRRDRLARAGQVPAPCGSGPELARGCTISRVRDPGFSP